MWFFQMYTVSFIQVMLCTLCIGCPQHLGALSTETKDVKCHRCQCYLQPYPLSVRLVSQSSVNNHQPALHGHMRAEFGDLKDLFELN